MDEVLAVEEVARYLKVHEVTVQRWCRMGDLPAAKMGRAYRIKETDLDTWWTARTRGSGTAAATVGRSSTGTGKGARSA